MKKLTIMAMILLLSACAGPTPQEAARADYGDYPLNYEAIVRAYHRTYLKDPDTVQYSGFSYPQQLFVGNMFSGTKYGFGVCVTYNARNSYGGYVGVRTDAVLIRNGVVLDYLPNGRNGAFQFC